MSFVASFGAQFAVSFDAQVGHILVILLEAGFPRGRLSLVWSSRGRGQNGSLHIYIYIFVL